MKKLLIGVIIFAVIAHAQMAVKASWQSKATSKLWVNEPAPPTSLPWGLSVWIRPTEGEARVRIQPEGGTAAEYEVADMNDVGNGWRYVLITGLSAVPGSVTISVMRWTSQPSVPVVVASVGPDHAGPQLAEVHTAKPGQSIFNWHLGGWAPDMDVFVDGEQVPFDDYVIGVTWVELPPMRGGETVQMVRAEPQELWWSADWWDRANVCPGEWPCEWKGFSK